MKDSCFLCNLIGKPVEIVCKDAAAAREVPPLVLREISVLGVVGENREGSHFFPWTEVAEIRPSKAEVGAEDLALAMCADSEP
ncbi:MAG: hypothetical protein ABSH44_10075 [Bryobacteraceae bacterium]|jgi:hypothetical protein